MDPDVFDDIVAGFYCAARGERRWGDALLPFQCAVSALAIHLLSLDLSDGRFLFSHSASQQPEAELDYITTYHRVDPRTRHAIENPVGVWMNCWEHFSDEFVANDRFYQDYLIPYGGRYVSGLKLRHEGSVVDLLGIHRGLRGRPLDADELVVCNRLARHLTDALAQQRASAWQPAQGLLGAEVLERLRAPVMLLDEERRLLHANPAARVFLDGGASLRESRGRVHCRDARDDANMLAAVKQLLGDEPCRSGAEAPDKVFVRASSATAAPVGLYFYRLTPQRTMGTFGGQPLAMLLLHRPGEQLELDPFVVAAAFDLTPGEARVAIGTAQGDSPADIARRHEVSTHTVRSQLRSVFAKTGAARQSQLVSVLSTLPMAALRLRSP